MKKIRVLQILDALDSGGAENVIVSYNARMDQTKYIWDYLIMDVPEIIEGRLESRVNNLGGKIYRVTRKKKNFIKHCKEVDDVIRKGKYDIVHSNLYELSAIYLYYAQRANVRGRIAHIHSLNETRGFMIDMFRKFLKPFLLFFANGYVACGRNVAKSFWGNRLINKGKVFVLTNAINSEEFKYNSELRNKLRQQYGIEDKIAVVAIARMTPQKNPRYIMKCFCEFKKIEQNSILFYIGNGEMEREIAEYANELHIEKDVVFMGVRNDINKLYNMFDILIMPSKYEGLPVVAIEAQCNGLNCLFSDRITDEIMINENAEMLSINKPACDWARKMKELVEENKKFDRNSGVYNIKKLGFDINDTANMLDSYYKDLLGIQTK